MSEYEKALYRVYDRTMDWLWTNGGSRDLGSNTSTSGGSSIGRSCPKWYRVMEVVLVVSALVVLLVGCHLHIAFVGKPGCLEKALITSAEGTNVVVPDDKLSTSVGNNDSNRLNEGEGEEGEEKEGVTSKVGGYSMQC